MKIKTRITNNFDTWPRRWDDFEVEAHYLSGNGNQTLVLLDNEKFQRFDENVRAGTEFLRSLENPARVAILGHGVLSRVKLRDRKIRSLAASLTKSTKTLLDAGQGWWLHYTLVCLVNPWDSNLDQEILERNLRQSIRQNPEYYEVVNLFTKMLELSAKIVVM